MTKENITFEFWEDSHPFQPFVKRFADTYQERQLNWNPYCIENEALFYEFVTGDEEEEIELISDACLNVLFELDGSNPRALFSGTFLHPKKLTLKANTTYFGFKPLSNLGFKAPNIDFKEMVNSLIDFRLAFPCARQLISALSEAESYDERTGIFTRFAWDHLIDHSYSPTFIDYVTVALCSPNGRQIYNNIDQVIGYSERYCREKFKGYYGISPKQYSDIIRFQNALKALINGWCKDLSSLAVECGYFDQSHLSRDFRRYTNEPPGRYLVKYISSLDNIPGSNSA